MLRRIFDQTFNGAALSLAARIEAHALRLSAAGDEPRDPRSLVELLQAASDLLGRLPTPRNDSPPASDAAPDSRRQTEDEPAATTPSPAPTPNPARATATDAQAVEGPSATARELMRLCDLVWMFRTAGGGVNAQATGELFVELSRVLACEGVDTLDEQGTLDPNRQRVAGTQPTQDAGEHNRVCATLRPGYRFGGRILRPQDVIIKTHSG